MRLALVALAATLLIASACSAAGSGGTGVPQNATPAPSSAPKATGGPSADPEYGY